MKAGFALKLQETFKAYFESRPPQVQPTSPREHQAKTRHKETGDASDLSSEDHEAALVINPSLGYRDECITVDARQDKRGQWTVVKGADAFDARNDAKKARKDTLLDPYCLVITRRFGQFGDLQCTLAEIQSPYVIHALRELVSYYPDNSFRVGETIKCEDPPKLIYYYRKELAEHQNRSRTDSRTSQHIGFLLNFLYSHIGEAIEQYETFLAAGFVKFDHLWMMFKPGSLVYEHETEQLYFFEKGDYAQTNCGPVFALECHYVDYNGEKLGKAKRTLHIRGFDNPREISALLVLPLALRSDRDELRQSLPVRARRFIELRGIHSLQHASKGRVMVDAKTFLQRLIPGDEDREDSQKRGMVIYEDCKCQCAVCRKEIEEAPDDYDHDIREISMDDMLLCSSNVLGFALTSHTWVWMKIKDLSDIEWCEEAIDRLVLDAKQKRVLSSLISSPVFTEGVQGDVIGWKGRGLVMLLHGAPGTGKTLTAESVCESLERPLYIVSAGELGITPEQIEKRLEDILELSKLWKAVILIDEADIFLEERSAHDIVRNNFVSVFLRRLEYFSGILILTTNRVEQFDEAFISRIHLALSYPELEPWMRKEIWLNALKRFPHDPAIDLEEISKIALNGRVISYAVRTAKAIADEDKVELGVQHLWDVVSVHQKFSGCLARKKGLGEEMA